MRMIPLVLTCLAAMPLTAPGHAQSGNLVVNPGFESPLSEGWSPIWTRDPDVATVALSGLAHSGSFSLEVDHRGLQDWCISQSAPLAVREGDIFAISGWIACTDVTGEAQFSVVARDSGGAVIEWCCGAVGTSGTHDWQQVATHFVVPQGCATIQFRIVGWGTGLMRFDDVSLVNEGNIIDIRGPDQDLEFGNAAIRVVFHTATDTFTVTDLRNGLVYDQLPFRNLPVVMGWALDPDGAGLTGQLWEPASDLTLELRLEARTTGPAVRCELSGAGPMPRELAYPAPFRAAPGWFAVVPMNEGIMYPVDDAEVWPMRLVGYSGHGISMGWFGISDGVRGPGVMGIIETPDDASIQIDRPAAGGNSELCIWPIWEPSRGEFGYRRAVTYLFLPTGGYLAQAKRYRQYAKEIGLYRSLREKQAANPNVDLLIGAVNVWAPTWYGNTDPLGLVAEMQSLGIERLLYSEGSSPAIVAALNARPGVLTSRYDIYQDVWPPGLPEWANHEGWPEDLVLLADGSILPGWVIRDGETLYPGGVICSKQGLEHAQAHIPEDLAATPYRCRFLDTTTASPWRECYQPAHPLTRSDDRYYKMELLRFCSEDMGMVTGTETGIDASVPYVHYYEGMLSLGPYRLPDCGYTLIDYKPPTPEFLKYQVGSYYRVPLWELVYHDCTVAMWYWGDSANKAPEVWDQRDLFNLLYGTPPLFMLSPEVWTAHKDRFVQSYVNVCPTVRGIGYDAMLAHGHLTRDHTLQRSIWSSGVTIVANFADHEQRLADGAVIAPLGWLVRDRLFSDLSPDSWAFPATAVCAGAGIVSGYGDGTYRPATAVTRDQMAVYISRALAGGDERVPTGPAEPTFGDVPDDHWAFKYVEYAVAHGIVSGYGDHSYRPGVRLDRAQMAAFVARAMAGGDTRIPEVPADEVVFPDLPSDFWARGYIQYIKLAGVTVGYGDGNYHPERVCTREQMAVYVARAFQLLG